MDIVFFLNAVKHAQIFSSIERELLSPKAKQQSIDEVKETITSLNNELHSWKAKLGADDVVNTAVQSPLSNYRLRMSHALYLQLCFHGSLCALHMTISQPWEINRFQQSRNPEHVAQVQESSRIVAEASRSIILSCQMYEISAASPVW